MTWDAYHQDVGRAVGVDSVNLVHIPTNLLERATAGRPVQSFWIFSYNYIFDNDRAMQDLNFRYTVPWVEGARRTIDRRESHGGNPVNDAPTFEDEVVEAWERLGAGMVDALAV